MKEGEITEAFRAKYLDDMAAGVTARLPEYQAIWPEHGELIAREYTLLQKTGGGAPGNRTPGAETPPARERRIGRYRIIRELGRGGQGVVYLAEDTKLGRRVALKALTALGHLSDHLISRFGREAEIASRLDHPGIATIYDTGSEDGIPYLAMHYVEGESLASRIASARESASRMDASASSSRLHSRAGVASEVLLIEKVARALHSAHQASVIHRDLKPGNIMVTPEGEPVILDFGLARDLEDPGGSMTRSGDLLGTPAYMPPEQIAAQRIRLDRRADIYSLGATLYELLTLRLPFEAATHEALYQAILTKDPVGPRKLNPSISRDLEVVLQTALEKDRDRRYTTAIDFAEDLRRARVLEPIRARPLSAPARIVRWIRRKPAQAAILGLFAVVALLGMHLVARWPEIRRGREERRREAVEEVLAEGYLETGRERPEKAIEAFRKALLLDPRTPEAVAGIALAHLRRQKPAEALEYLETRSDLDAGFPELGWIRADALRASGRESEAGEIDGRLGEPGTALGCFLLGSREVERGHSGDAAAFPRALNHFLQAVLLSPRARAAYHYEVAHAAGHAAEKEAADAITKALQALWPDSVRTLFWTGFALGEVDPARAVRAYRKALEKVPEESSIHLNLGSASRLAGDIDGSILALRKAIELRPDSYQTHHQLGISLLEKGDKEEALKAFRETIRLKPDYPEAHLNAAIILSQRGENEEAIRELREAIRHSPEYGDAHNNLGLALLETGDLEEATGAFRKAMELGPESWNPHYGMSKVLLARGELDGALDACREALLRKPNDPDVLLTMGVCLRTKGDLEGAVASNRKALEIDPSYAEVHCNLGLVLMDLGRYEEALASLRKGHQLGSVNSRWRYPSAEWIERCERLVELERKLKRVISGEARPDGAGERAELASMAYTKRLHATSARLEKEALAEKPELGEDPTTFRRYNAACAAALAAAGEGEEGKLLDDAERALWRDQALDWLEADLAAWQRLLAEGKVDKEETARQLADWKVDADLAGLREEDRIAALDENERARCRALWKAVEDAIAGTRRPEGE